MGWCQSSHISRLFSDRCFDRFYNHCINCYLILALPFGTPIDEHSEPE